MFVSFDNLSLYAHTRHNRGEGIDPVTIPWDAIPRGKLWEFSLGDVSLHQLNHLRRRQRTKCSDCRRYSLLHVIVVEETTADARIRIRAFLGLSPWPNYADINSVCLR